MSRILAEALALLDFWGAHPRKLPYSRTLTRLLPCVALCVYGLLKMVQYTVVNWKSVATLGENADGFPTAYQAVCKVAFVFCYRKDLSAALETIAAFRISNLRPGTDLSALVDDLHRKSGFLYRMFRNVLVFGGVLYATKPLSGWERGLPMVADLPICDIDANSCYVFWYLVEIMGVVFTMSFTVAAECMFFAFVSYAYVELEAIKHGFENLDVREELKFHREFALLIEHHSVVLMFIDRLSKMYGLVLLQQFACQIAAICFMIFNLSCQRMSVQLVASTVPILMAYHGELFVVCSAGNLLTDQASEVADALYACNWYENLHPRIAKGVLMVMQRAQRPVKLSVIGIWDLDNAMFVKIVKTSFSVMALVQTFYDFTEQ